MKKLIPFFALAALSAVSGLLHAQGNSVSLIENDGKMAIFSVEATAAKSGDVSKNALTILFRTLLDDGVEGLLGGEKLMQIPNPKWRSSFLAQKNQPYMAYVKGYQTEGEPQKNSVGEYAATVLVRLNVEFLFRQLKAYGVMRK